MPKRKRVLGTAKQSQDDLPSENPFLEFRRLRLANIKKDTKEDEKVSLQKQTFRLVVKFLQLNRQKKDAKIQQETKEVVAQLVEILEGISDADDKETEDDSFMSHSDIAQTILPWAIKGILHNSRKNDTKLEWRVLKIGTALAIDSMNKKGTHAGNNYDGSSNALSTSVLHKLVPVTASIGCQGDTDINEMAATTYCALVDRLYRPNFDVVCNKLLPQLIDEMSKKEETNDRLARMLSSTLSLIQQSLKKANHKKAFQMLVTAESMIALSRAYYSISTSQLPLDQNPSSLVVQILREGLFNTEHHMDGFRSLQLQIPDLTSQAMEVDSDSQKEAPGKSLICYQQELLSTIDQELSLSVKDTTRFHSIVKILPILLESFFHETQKMLQENAKKKAAVMKIGRLQFNMFARFSAPLGRLLDNHVGNEKVLLQSLEKCVQLVLSRDVYRPSNEDAEDTQFSFLQQLSSILYKGKFKSIQDVLPILLTMLQLNHLILHENLSEVFTSCLGSIPDCKSSMESRQFIQGVVSTYSKLRQLDYFCTSVLATFNQMLNITDVDGLKAFVQLIESEEVSGAFCSTVQASPFHQCKKVLSDFNEWIATTALSLPDGKKEIAGTAISGVVVLLSNLLKTVRVDGSSALELSGMVQAVFKDAVTTMVGPIDDLASVEPLGVQGIRLCGWALSLKNRCDFWTRGEQKVEDYDIPNEVIRILSVASQGISLAMSENIHTSRAIEELQILACHRLRQLHIRAQEMEKISLAVDTDQSASEENAKETKELARFALMALTHGDQDEHLSQSKWTLLAGSIGLWVPYVDSTELEHFLAYFWAGIATIQPDREPESLDVDQRHQLASHLLLEDTSFFEVPKIAQAFGKSAITFVHNCILEFASDNDKSKKKNQSFDIKSLAWPLIGSQSVHHLMTKSHKLHVKFKKISSWKDDNCRLASGNRCLTTLNGISSVTWDACTDMESTLSSCIRLDFICKEMAVNGGQNCYSAANVVVGIRTSMSRILQESSQGLLDDDMDKNLFEYIFASTNDMIRKLPIDVRSKILNASSSLIQTILTHVKSDGQEAVFRACVDTYASMIEDRDEFNTLLLSHFGTAIISGLPIFDKSSGIVEAIALSTIERSMDVVFNMDESSRPAVQSCLLFLAELFQIDNTNMSDKLRSKLDSIERKISKQALKILGSDLTFEEQGALFLILSIISSKPSDKTRKVLFDGLINYVSEANSIVDAALCGLITDMGKDELQESLKCLVSTPKTGYRKTGPLPRLNLLRLIILNAASPMQNDALSSVAQRFFSMALHVFDSSSEPDQFKHAVALIMDLASRKDIILIREREVALILSYVATSLSIESHDEKQEFPSTKAYIFNSCFTLVSFLQQRFTKQLFSCIPSFVIVLSLFLDHTLYGHLDPLEAMDRGQKFSRLCELLLPHGDVYKKHVVCLLVQYVQALKENLEPVRRESLSPAIFCLLDVLQKHETMLLNASLDDMGRALLRTVNESYKKVHAYKGQ